MQSQTSTTEMIKELKGVKNLFSTNSKESESTVFSLELEQQAKLDLAIVLQMSLDIGWIINKFMEHVHSYFLFDGFVYVRDESNTEIKYARQKGHSCYYNLHVDNIDLGQLKLFRGRKFKESELMLLETLLTVMVYPLRNAIQYKQAELLAHCDALTGIKNRATFDESLDREINLSKRYKHDFTMLLVDIDFFKKVNDVYGHKAGDDALKHVANAIQNSIRVTDMLFRYGGEEFVVLLGNTNSDKAYDVADRILNSVRNIDMQAVDEKVNLSVSIGMSCLDKKDTSDSLFVRADTAMYASKNNGRDQITVA